MLYVNGYAVSLDRREHGADIDFVSHGHSDHIAAARKGSRILASSETVQLVKRVHKRNIEPYEHRRHGWLKLLNAGHIFGSRQLCMDDYSTGRRIVYTGDYQMQSARAAEPIEVVEADSVVIDSTYPHPRIRFERRAEVESAIQRWAACAESNGIALLGAYALGKSQELIAILNEVGIRPVVSRKINAVNEIYTEHGIKLEYASAYKREPDHEEALSRNFVGIVESNKLMDLAWRLGRAHGKRVHTAVATGFANAFKFPTEAQFALSDHADFRQAVDYIDATGADAVYTYGKGARELAENLARLGYNATQFDGIGQPQQSRTCSYAAGMVSDSKLSL